MEHDNSFCGNCLYARQALQRSHGVSNCLSSILWIWREDVWMPISLSRLRPNIILASDFVLAAELHNSKWEQSVPNSFLIVRVCLSDNVRLMQQLKELWSNDWSPPPRPQLLLLFGFPNKVSLRMLPPFCFSTSWISSDESLFSVCSVYSIIHWIMTACQKCYTNVSLHKEIYLLTQTLYFYSNTACRNTHID